jgi:hypothetical protein
MHNRLIFLYHRVRANPKSGLLRGCLRTNLDQTLAGSEGGTQEGKSTRAMVVPG